MSKVRSKKGPMPEGAHRDLMSDRGRRQGQTGGATALTRASSCTRMISLGQGGKGGVGVWEAKGKGTEERDSKFSA